MVEEDSITMVLRNSGRLSGAEVNDAKLYEALAAIKAIVSSNIEKEYIKLNNLSAIDVLQSQINILISNSSSKFLKEIATISNAIIKK